MGITPPHQTGKDKFSFHWYHQYHQRLLFIKFFLQHVFILPIFLTCVYFFFKSSYVILINRDGHHSSTSNRHAERAKTSCSAPTQSRSPSAHRSRSVSAALRQAGSPVKSLTQSAYSSDIGLSLKELLFLPQAEECWAPPSLQASLLSSDPSGSGLTIGPNAWLKRKVINCSFQLFHFTVFTIFQLHLRPQHRGVHLVTEEILAGLPELAQFQVMPLSTFIFLLFLK